MEVRRWDVEAVAPSEIGLDIIGITGSNPKYHWFLVRDGRFLILHLQLKPPPIEENRNLLFDILRNSEV